MLSASDVTGFGIEEPRDRFRPLARIAFVVLMIAALLQPGAPATAADANSPDALLVIKVRQAGLGRCPAA